MVSDDDVKRFLQTKTQRVYMDGALFLFLSELNRLRVHKHEPHEVFSARKNAPREPQVHNKVAEETTRAMRVAPATACKPLAETLHKWLTKFFMQGRS